MWSKPIKNNSGKITIEVSEVQIFLVPSAKKSVLLLFKQCFVLLMKKYSKLFEN